MAEKLTQEFVELLQQEIETVMEIHQVEFDARFDRLQHRLRELEDAVLLGAQRLTAVERRFEEMDRTIAEAELALRKYVWELLSPVQAGIDAQNELLELLKATIDAQLLGNFGQGGI